MAAFVLGRRFLLLSHVYIEFRLDPPDSSCQFRTSQYNSVLLTAFLVHDHIYTIWSSPVDSLQKIVQVKAHSTVLFLLVNFHVLLFLRQIQHPMPPPSSPGPSDGFLRKTPDALPLFQLGQIAKLTPFGCSSGSLQPKALPTPTWLRPPRGRTS